MSSSGSTVLRDLHERFVVEERIETAAARKRLHVVSLLLVIVPLACFVVILGDVLQADDIALIDAPIQAWLAGARTELWTGAMIAVSVFFGPIMFPFVALLVTVVWGLTARHVWRPFLLAIGILAAVASVRLLAMLVGRERPPLVDMLHGPEFSESFPSGHVVGASASMLLVAYLVFSRRKRPLSGIVAFAIATAGIVATATSRIYLGYHWATDALAAICVALIVLGLIIAIDTHRTVRVAGDPQTRTAHPVRTDTPPAPAAG